MSETEEQVVATPEPDPVEQALEERARNMGWRPREGYRGDPQLWLSAREYVERGEKLLPMLQERTRAQERMIGELRQQMANQGDTLNNLLTHTRNAERVGYRRAMRELEEQKVRAVEQGDTQAFRAVEQAIRELGPEPAPEPPKPPQQPQANNDPVVAAWVQRNSWFRTDPVANAAMIAAMQSVERENPGRSTEENLLDAENRIRNRFPEHFGAPRRTNGSGSNGYDHDPPQRRPLHMQDDEPPPPRQQASVARSNDWPPPRRVQPRTFDALPPEVKAQYERQRKMLEGKGEPFTKEEFANYYFEQEAE